MSDQWMCSFCLRGLYLDNGIPIPHDHSDHLPECPQFCDGKPPKCRGGDCTLCDEVDCYCDRLRACEERVREDDKNTFLRAAYDTGREDGLSAARDAIDALREGEK